MTLPNPTVPTWLPQLGFGVDIDGSRIETSEAFIERSREFYEATVAGLREQLAETAAGRESAEAERNLVSKQLATYPHNRIQSLEIELAAAAEREAGLAKALDEVLYELSDKMLASKTKQPAIDALASYAAAHPDAAGRHGPGWAAAPSELPQ